MTTTLCLVRHGQTDWNKEKLIQGTNDIKLNELGKKQAFECSKTIIDSNITFDYIITSPLSRAYETGKIILDNASDCFICKELIVNEGLIERDFGDLEGQPVCEKNYVLMNNGNVNGLESLDTLKNRSHTVIMDIANKFIGKKILITTHSQFIKGLISSIDDTFDFTSLIRNSSLNIFEIKNNTIKIIGLNKNRWI